MEELDFQMLAEFALSKWCWGTGGDIKHCVQAMINEKLPYEYIEYAFGISKNEYYYYLNLEIQNVSKIIGTTDYDAIKDWLNISESDYQNALKTGEEEV